MAKSKKSRIESFIRKKGMCQAVDIMNIFSLSKMSVINYFRQLGVLTSFNAKGQYYILPECYQFDESALLFIGKVGFYKGGNLLAAICHLVETSPRGLGARELDGMLKTTTHSQLPKLYRTGRLRREQADDRPGNAYIYFSADIATYQEQYNAYVSAKEAPEEIPELADDALPDVIEVLLTLIAHPDFSAKSVALSLQRRGRKVSSAFTTRVFQKYHLSKKTS